ncbi:YbaB/EbfC family nucleoid-associated protein [Saccharothrix hoggarensis]|uniref:YbaB/EbfC family nucleoid-associated protein n=1 Tax=Saccharothrix hoggarensis TaxID=913853 RepID=A0ABW3QPC4_9PSEU
MDPARMIADLETKARELARRSREVQDGIRAVAATVRSPDGWVTATVAPNGALRDISFSLPAEGLSDAQLGWVVMTTVQRAQAQVARQVAEVVQPDFAGTAAMEFMAAYLPDEPRADVPRADQPRADVPVGVRADVSAGVPRREPEPSDLPLPRSLWCPAEAGEPSSR